LVLVQPATVDRWHRERIPSMLAASRAASRKTMYRFAMSRSDSALATENCLWGVPRIDRELLKLGIAISDARSRVIRAVAQQHGHKPGVHSSRTTSLTEHSSRR